MENFEPPKLKDNKIERIITHEGIFHTDEVFATAILKDLFPESMESKSGAKGDYVKYLRTREKGVLERGLDLDSTMLLDQGGVYNFDKYNLDHHQEGGAGKRDNGVEYASAGLVWKHYGKEWIKYVDTYTRKINLTEQEIELIWKIIDKQYVQLIDANDTGQMEEVSYSIAGVDEVKGGQFTMAEVVRLANIDCRDGKNQQDRFNGIVETFRSTNLSMVNKNIDLIEGLRKFDINKCDFSHDGKVVVINELLLPAATVYLIDNEEKFKKVEYYAVETVRHRYSVLVAPVGEGLREYRNPSMIPKELRLGSDTKKINEILGVEDGAIFSHGAGYFASFKDLESTKKFLDYCISQSGK